MRCVNSLLALTLLAGCATHALALPSDSSQPIRIQADSATLDDKRNTAVYTGNVIITQGSMRLTGGRVTLSTNANGELNTMVTYGSRLPTSKHRRPTRRRQGAGADHRVSR
ncbi:LptA/OstA family protein [Halopseudomonas pachastrellae]|nr:LptA/OstA family protein [Halopseudomonas pachastrellae]